MRKLLACFSVAVFSYFVFAPALIYAGTNKWENLVEESGMVLAEVQKMPDQGIPDNLLRKCEAIAIFPTTISGGFVIGGKYGQGIIMVRQKNRKWSAPAIFTLVGGNIGWQIGGQATDFVLLIMSRRSVDGLLQGKFKLGADASVAAGPVGRDAEASTDIQLKGGILSYSRSRGLFAGVKLEGAVIAQEWNGNETLYGQKLSAKDILIEGKANMPKSADDLLSILNKY